MARQATLPGAANMQQQSLQQGVEALTCATHFGSSPILNQVGPYH